MIILKIIQLHGLIHDAMIQEKKHNEEHHMQCRSAVRLIQKDGKAMTVKIKIVLDDGQ